MGEREDKRPDGEPEMPDEAEAQDAETRAAERLRDALEANAPQAPDDELELVNALRAAWSPGPLDPGAHAEIVDDAPASVDESAAAAELANALGTAREPDVVAALRSAWNPSALSDEEHRAIVRGAIERPKVLTLWRMQSRRIAVAATTTLALAAGVLVWLTTSSPADVPLARSRTTAPLFDGPFGEGNGSARIDRIAVARSADYRDNRFAQWGLR
jgi:hypothetical protein